MDVSEHTWKLSDPGMDLLERAGLAGLHMALTAASEAGRDLSPLTWTDADLTEDSVTVRWTGPPKPAFQKLIEWAWQVRDGVLYFPAVHERVQAANWHLRVSMHNGIMRTFLQHPNVQPKLDAVTRGVQIGEDKHVTVSFEPPAMRVDDLERPVNEKTKRPHKKKVASSCVKPHDDIEGLFTSRDQFKRPVVSLSNWLYPGIAGRYGEEKSWEGQAERAVLLMLAPTVCLYQRLQGEGNNWVVVVPDVRDLEAFGDARRRLHLGPEFVDVASLGDAGLRFVAEFGSQPARRELEAGCRVLAMGYVGYYQGQSIRKSVLDVGSEPIPVRRYRRLQGTFPNHFVRRKADPPASGNLPPKKGRGKAKPVTPTKDAPTGNGWYKLPTGRGRIADNLVNGRPWYRDLFVPMQWDSDEVDRIRKQHRGMSAERLWFTALSYQRTKLMRLIAEDDMWDTEAEKVFIEACWQMLDSLYAQEADAVKRGGSRTAADRFEHLNDDIRRSLLQAKTRTLLRAVLSGLFARAGRQKQIGAHTPAIWRLIDHPEHWQKGRDLALLALASHRSKAVREGKEPDTDPADDTEIQKEAAQ